MSGAYQPPTGASGGSPPDGCWSYSMVRRTRAGAPAAIENGGRSVVTTLLAPITQRSPMVTPLVTTTCAPHHTLSAIRVGPLVLKPCQGTGLWGSSKRWLPSVTKQPLANMQCSPISTSSTAAIMTVRFRNDPPPVRMRPGAGAVSQTPGSNSTCGPSSSRPSRSISSTSPWIGQRAKASRRASSRWIAARRCGSVLRGYTRHFCSHRRACAPVSTASGRLLVVVGRAALAQDAREVVGDLRRRALGAARAQARLDAVQGRALGQVLLGGLQLAGELVAQLAQALLGVADGL